MGARRVCMGRVMLCGEGRECVRERVSVSVVEGGSVCRECVWGVSEGV